MILANTVNNVDNVAIAAGPFKGAPAESAGGRERTRAPAAMVMVTAMTTAAAADAVAAAVIGLAPP